MNRCEPFLVLMDAIINVIIPTYSIKLGRVFTDIYGKKATGNTKTLIRM